MTEKKLSKAKKKELETKATPIFNYNKKSANDVNKLIKASINKKKEK